MEKTKLRKLILKIVFNLDLLILLIVQSIAVDSYLNRPQYKGADGYIVDIDGSSEDCDPQQAYHFTIQYQAQTAAEVINKFGQVPAIIVIFNLFADIGISVYKLVQQLRERLKPQFSVKLTKALLYMTLFFGPLSFPLSDFDYETCIETDLSQTIMKGLGTYSTLGVTLLVNTGTFLLIILAIRFLCGREQKQGKCAKCITKTSRCYMYISVLYYIVLSFMFLYFAIFGTINSILTFSFLSIATIAEGMEFCMQVKALNDLKKDLQETTDQNESATNTDGNTVETEKSLQNASDHGMKPGANKI